MNTRPVSSVAFGPVRQTLRSGLSILLAVLLCVIPIYSQNTAVDKRQAKIRQEITRRADSDTCMRVKLTDGTQVKGYIQQVGEQDFMLMDKDTQEVHTLRFEDVQQANKHRTRQRS